MILRLKIVLDYIYVPLITFHIVVILYGCKNRARTCRPIPKSQYQKQTLTAGKSSQTHEIINYIQSELVN